MEEVVEITGPIVETAEDAWKIQNQYPGLAHGWIQWKGTAVCMDIYCKCGESSHVDSDFCYNVKCGSCGRVYMCNGYIELIELRQEPKECVVVSET